MKLKFLGSGGAFTLTNFQSNMLLTLDYGKSLLIDCGGDARFGLKEAGFNHLDIDAVYISHLHNDHIGGLEWLGYIRYFDPASPGRPRLFVNEEHYKGLCTVLMPGMEDLTGKLATIDTYFDVCVVNDAFVWQYEEFHTIRNQHVVSLYKEHCSYGLVFNNDERYHYISTDSAFTPDVLNHLNGVYDFQYIFHDCETIKGRSGVHAHYEDLKTLPLEVKAKMWLYHYSDDYLNDETDRQSYEDGFGGFVRKGDEFYL